MEVVTGATGSLLSKLGELLHEEYKLQTNVKKDVEYLQKELTFMRAALRKVAEVAPELLDEQVKAWASNVKELSYDMVDTIDTFRVRVDANKAADKDSSSVIPLKKIERARARRQLAEEIENMKSLTNELVVLRDRYLLDNALTKPVQQMNSPRIYELWTWCTDYDIASIIGALKRQAQLINVRIIYQLWTWWTHRDIMQHMNGRTVYYELRCRLHSTMYYLQEQVQQFAEWHRKCVIEVLKSSEDESSSSDDPEFESLENHQTNRQQVIGLKEVVGVLDKDMQKLDTWLTDRKNMTTSVLYITGPQGVGKTTIATALYRKFRCRFERGAVVVSGSSNQNVLMKSILDQVRPQPKHGKANNNPSGDVTAGGTGMSGNGERVMHADAMAPSVVVSPLRQLNTMMNFRWPSIIHQRSSGSNSGPSGSPNETCYEDQLMEHLKEHSCLLFIDNVCDEKTLKTIRDLLPTNKGCKIIVTTRFTSVAAAWEKDIGDCIHNVGFLGGKKSKELFMDAFSESRIFIKNYEGKRVRNIPARLWEMCGGHPLAIVTMAGYVACNRDKSMDAWKQVCCLLVPDPTRVLTEDSLPRMLSHCYNDMPAEMKTCSLYLSMYPKGCKISKKHLIRRWLAEGFVSEKPGQTAVDVAEAYFSDLIARKILQPVECSSSGNVKSCHIYEIVHDYIVSKAFEENFAIAVGGNCWPMAPSSSKVRRLSLQNGESLENAKKTMNLSHVRSLCLSLSSSSMTKVLNSSNFPILQVLDLEGCSDFQDSKELYKMLLLKYLGLRGTGIKKVHEKIEKLKNLETLDIRETNVTALPPSICNLEKLVNILGGNKGTRKALKLPQDVKNMKALRVLSGVEITEEDIALEDLEHLISKLTKLVIYKLQIKQGKLLSSVLCSSYLRALAIYDDSTQCLLDNDDLTSSPKSLIALEIHGRLDMLPKWISGLVALTQITLPITTVREDALKKLSFLRVLFSLTFSVIAENQDPEFPLENQDTWTAIILERNKAYSDGEIFIPAGGFQNLKLLRFSAPVVPLLSFAEKAMPNLQRLELRFCILEGIYGIENLRSLKEVRIGVHNKADDFTMSLVEGIQAATGVVRVIVDQYYV